MRSKISTRVLLYLNIALSVILLCMHVSKETFLIKNMYTQQRILTEIKQVTLKINSYERELCSLKNPTTIRQYAQKKLQMRPLRVTEIGRLTIHDTTCPAA